MADTTTVCETCGAAVFDGDLHARWHRDEPHRIEKAVNARLRRAMVG